jgi:hypothetical protein
MVFRSDGVALKFHDIPDVLGERIDQFVPSYQPTP